MMWGELPDELWRSILEMGVATSRLNHRDLCSISISSRRLRRLSSEPSFWSSLLARDFPSSNPPSSSPKSLYVTAFQRDRARKLTARRLDVLNVESQIAVCARTLKDLQAVIVQEHAKLKTAAADHVHLDQVRRNSVALNVWQPEVVRSSQRKTVEQCSIPIGSRILSLEMEIEVCKQQIAIHTNAYKGVKQRLSELKKKLASLKYHPVYSILPGKNSCGSSSKRRRIEQCSDCTTS